jgi:hypothetical protein
VATDTSAPVGCDSVIDVTHPVEVPNTDRRWWAQAVSEALGPVPLGVALCVGPGAATDRWAGAG